MPEPVTTTTEQDDVILRFLKAAQARIDHHNGRVPFNSAHGRLVVDWMRGIVGRINDDGSLS